MNTATQLAPGFDDPVHQGQQAYRAVLDALARPGRIECLPGLPERVPGLGPASAAIALTLVDFETPVWLDAASAEAAAFLRFHCGCAIVDDPRRAHFAFARGFDNLPSLDSFALGSDDAPQDSTTLIVEVEDLFTDGPLVLSGPGIERQHRLGVAGFDTDRIAERVAMAELFPRGLDVFLTCGQRVAGLPRTTRIHSLRSEPCTSR
jgi:alpha-D-ribose 1-methylphosphonate 5-triphosphate synthase subunit PhnH